VQDTVESIRLACPLPWRADRPSTAALLLGEPFWGLT
jgi:hypothetical protein